MHEVSHDPQLITEGAPRGAGGGYAVKLPIFEGPLDLLLHLIRQNEVEITEIPIAVVGQQYLDYLELMRELDLDMAGDYLVMAATLALIKSRMLLPPEPGERDEDEIDPHAELVARLLEYQRFKEAAEELARRRLLGRDVFEAQGPGPERVPESEREITVGLFQLIEAFRDVLEAGRGAGTVHEVETETITVRERMLAVMRALETAESLEFTQVFETADGGPPTRAVLVATFLAILELARLAALRLYQGAGDDGAPWGPIRVRITPAHERMEWDDQISELM
ncbi:MAG: segregation/condensation protein A [Proteobacteria bacterium]|nr:segregation/condensation protein A [Pseudomonadota bacterium]MCZ6784374.1 segregation/condensation protein A [Pseudomonadota bacterium]